MKDLLTRLITLDRSSATTLVNQVTEQLRKLIVSGQLAEGYALPSSRSMATGLGVSRNTVMFAIEQLQSEGYISTAQGQLPVVNQVPPAHANWPDRTILGKQNSRPKLSPWAEKALSPSWPPDIPGTLRPFRPGYSDDRLFPSAIWARILRRAALSYSPQQDDSMNRSTLRSALQSYLSMHRGVNANASQIFVLPMAQSALSLIASVLLRPKDLVWLEDPGYGGAYAAFTAAGARIIGLPVDREGLVIGNRRSQPKLIFITPSHQYPTGRLMSIRRRLELVARAESEAAWIVEDDYDGEFHYDGRPVPSVQGLDPHGRTIYVGTFVKSMHSTVRIGYVVVPPELVNVFIRAQRHLGYLVPVHVQDAIAQFMDDGHFLSHIRSARRTYHQRRDYLAKEFERVAGDAVRVEVPAGGLQLLCRFDTDLNDVKLAAELAGRGVVAVPLSSLYINSPVEVGLFLGFAAWKEHEIKVAVKVLGGVLASF